MEKRPLSWSVSALTKVLTAVDIFLFTTGYPVQTHAVSPPAGSPVK